VCGGTAGVQFGAQQRSFQILQLRSAHVAIINVRKLG
jgi:hypothetical protein